MKVAYKLPDWPFQDEGDVCESCQAFWKEEELPPKKMAAVYGPDGSIVRTPEKGVPIFACRHCDGDLLFELPKKMPEDLL